MRATWVSDGDRQTPGKGAERPDTTGCTIRMHYHLSLRSHETHDKRSHEPALDQPPPAQACTAAALTVLTCKENKET